MVDAAGTIASGAARLTAPCPTLACPSAGGAAPRATAPGSTAPRRTTAGIPAGRAGRELRARGIQRAACRAASRPAGTRAAPHACRGTSQDTSGSPTRPSGAHRPAVERPRAWWAPTCPCGTQRGSPRVHAVARDSRRRPAPSPCGAPVPRQPAVLATRGPAQSCGCEWHKVRTELARGRGDSRLVAPSLSALCPRL
jgi:hypothetical protein